MDMTSFQIRTITPEDHAWIAHTLANHWGSPVVVSREVIYHADQLPGYIAMLGENPSGLVTYHIDAGQCQIITLDSLVHGAGIGTGLIDAVIKAAIQAGCTRVWLITTNDNTRAIRFYQKRGFHLNAVYPNAVLRSRELKPSIPLTGYDGIPIRDEIEFAMQLKQT